ncbi:hypothetical protein HK098_007908, partial [Nowakowskiella sp. JEL0407]
KKNSLGLSNYSTGWNSSHSPKIRIEPATQLSTTIEVPNKSSSPDTDNFSANGGSEGSTTGDILKGNLDANGCDVEMESVRFPSSDGTEESVEIETEPCDDGGIAEINPEVGRVREEFSVDALSKTPATNVLFPGDGLVATVEENEVENEVGANANQVVSVNQESTATLETNETRNESALDHERGNEDGNELEEDDDSRVVDARVLLQSLVRKVDKVNSKPKNTPRKRRRSKDDSSSASAKVSGSKRSNNVKEKQLASSTSIADVVLFENPLLLDAVRGLQRIEKKDQSGVFKMQMEITLLDQKEKQTASHGFYIQKLTQAAATVCRDGFIRDSLNSSNANLQQTSPLAKFVDSQKGVAGDRLQWGVAAALIGMEYLNMLRQFPELRDLSENPVNWSEAQHGLVSKVVQKRGEPFDYCDWVKRLKQAAGYQGEHSINVLGIHGLALLNLVKIVPGGWGILLDESLNLFNFPKQARVATGFLGSLCFGDVFRNCLTYFEREEFKELRDQYCRVLSGPDGEALGHYIADRFHGTQRASIDYVLSQRPEISITDDGVNSQIILSSPFTEGHFPVSRWEFKSFSDMWRFQQILFYCGFKIRYYLLFKVDTISNLTYEEPINEEGFRRMLALEGIVLPKLPYSPEFGDETIEEEILRSREKDSNVEQDSSIEVDVPLSGI